MVEEVTRRQALSMTAALAVAIAGTPGLAKTGEDKVNLEVWQTGVQLDQDGAQELAANYADQGWRLPAESEIPTIRKAWEEGTLKASYPGNPSSQYAAVRLDAKSQEGITGDYSHVLTLNANAFDGYSLDRGVGVEQAASAAEIPVVLVRGETPELV